MSQSVNAPKPVFIDSTFRNRISYPKQSSFTIPFSSGNEQSSFLDPIIDGVPYFNGLTASVIVANVSNTVDLGLTASNTYNFYNGQTLEIGGQFVTIISYDGTTHIATFVPVFTAGFAIGTAYIIRRARPSEVNTLIANGTITTAVLIANTVAVVGNYIRFTSGVNTGLIRRIVSITGSTITFSSVTAATLLGDSYEILALTRDNAQSLFYSGGLASDTQAVLYSIKLLHLVIPNVVVSSGGGGNLRDFPYLMVEFHNDGQFISNSVIYSNNPNTRKATFIVPNDSEASQAPTTVGLKLVHCKEEQVLKFKPTAAITFTVRHLNGDEVVVDGTNFPANAETFSPFPPNPLVQFQAMFEIQRIA